MNKVEWLLCPVCKSKTRMRIREDTTLTNFPLLCPKCKQETLINVRQLNMSDSQLNKEQRFIKINLASQSAVS